METHKFKISILWVVSMCGLALHTLADLLPPFWNVNITMDTSGEAPNGLLAFMMIVSYLIPIAGILCTSYGYKRPWFITNCILATFMLFFNIFHLSEMFMDFNVVQLPLLPIILVVSIFLFRESWNLVKSIENNSHTQKTRQNRSIKPLFKENP